MIMLDTCFIVSSLLDNEKNHERAKELSKRFDPTEVSITHTIMVEVLTYSPTDYFMKFQS